MNNRLIDDVVLREYLLGRLEDDQEFIEYIDEQMLTDLEFSTSVDIVEDEIIEEYLESSMADADKRAVEKHFLRPPERQERLRTARLIQRHLSAPMPLASTPDNVSPIRRASILRVPQVGIWGAIAAVVLLAVCLLSVLRQHRRVHSLELAELQFESQSRELSARNEPVVSAPAIALNLLHAGLTRGANQFPELDLPARAVEVEVNIALDTSSPGPFRITLLHNDAVVWTGPSLRASPVADGGILRVEIPAMAIPEGRCAVALKSVSGADVVYWFTVRRL